MKSKNKAELDKEFIVDDAVAKDDLGLDRETLGDDKYIEALEEKLGQALADSVMCRNLTQRLQADFDNYRKRNVGLAEEMKQLGISMVVEKLLGVLDNCAEIFLSDTSACAVARGGLENVVGADVKATLTIPLIQRLTILNRDDKVVIHNEFQTCTNAGVNTTCILATVNLVEVGNNAGDCGTQLACLLIKLPCLGNHTHIHKGVGGEVPVLLEEAEVHEFHASLKVGPSVAIGKDTVLEHAPDRVLTAQALVLNLTKVEGSGGLLEVEARPVNAAAKNKILL